MFNILLISKNRMFEILVKSPARYCIYYSSRRKYSSRRFSDSLGLYFIFSTSRFSRSDLFELRRICNYILSRLNYSLRRILPTYKIKPPLVEKKTSFRRKKNSLRIKYSHYNSHYKYRQKNSLCIKLLTV